MVTKVFKAISFVLILVKSFGFAAENPLNKDLDDISNYFAEDAVSEISENRSTKNSSFYDFLYDDQSFFEDHNPFVHDKKNGNVTSEILGEQSTESSFFRYSFIYHPQNSYSFIEYNPLFYERTFFIYETETKDKKDQLDYSKFIFKELPDVFQIQKIISLDSNSNLFGLKFVNFLAEKKLYDSFMRNHLDAFRIYYETCQLKKNIPLLMIEDVKSEKIKIIDNSVVNLIELNQNTEEKHDKKPKEESDDYLAETEPYNDKFKASVVIAGDFQNVIDQYPAVSAGINFDGQIGNCKKTNLITVNIAPAIQLETATETTTQEAKSDSDSEFDGADECGIDGMNDISANEKINSNLENETRPDSGVLISKPTSETPQVSVENDLVPATIEIVPAPSIIAPVITAKAKEAISQKTKSSSESTSLFMIFILFGVFGLIVFVSALGVWQYRKAQVQL